MEAQDVGSGRPGARRSRSLTIRFALVLGAVAALAVAAMVVATRSESGPEPDSAVAPVMLADANGASYRVPSGKPEVLYFMTTTGCVACEAGAVRLSEALATHDVGVVALEVVPDTPSEWLTDYQAALGLVFPVVQDPDGELTRRYGIVDLGVAVVIDAGGLVVAGPFDPADPAQLAEAWTQVVTS